MLVILAGLIAASAVAAGRGGAMAALVIGGTGDLQQAARTGNTVACGFFRPDEGLSLHRVSVAKKAVATYRERSPIWSATWSRQPPRSIYRHQIRPVVLHGAEAMDRIFPEG